MCCAVALCWESRNPQNLHSTIMPVSNPSSVCNPFPPASGQTQSATEYVCHPTSLSAELQLCVRCETHTRSFHSVCMHLFSLCDTQELSVWAGVAHSQQQVPEQRQQWPAQLHGMDPSSAAGSAESTGRMACSLMLAYQELQAVMDCVSTVMQQYQALQVGEEEARQ